MRRDACATSAPPLDSLAGPDSGDDREEYPTPRGRAGRVETSSQRAGGAASRHEDGGEWTREPRSVCRGRRPRVAEDGWHRGRTDLSSRLYGRTYRRSHADRALRSPRPAPIPPRPRLPSWRVASRWAGTRHATSCPPSSTATSRRPSWVACCWPSASAPRPPMSWPASWRRCEPGCWSFGRPRVPSTPAARVAMSTARSTSRPRPRS